ncbi:MFS transporter [Gordonia sp. PS3]|uniref:Nitrite/nitrate transporter n=1 Tax=Gordonia sihwensis NBRC 108236 TaxID=1223544 RepID=L7LJ89_9ACTN|nr:MULTISPECIES: nitrate/nitrite transporter [Gordonia]AUH69372.1 NarK/NasA family nitrate transporter [Gordonia sp. YC-JH1]MBY4571768.1 MFS transporter [Gordonia sihwensis]GAC61195.1 nitrite/nitrate transporter [Gordonia sihwensis NBRC 108236]
MGPAHTRPRERRAVFASRTITDWDPEDTAAWEAGGSAIARRNLIWSVVAEHVGFSVWTLWSVMVLFMPSDVYGISAGDKFLIGAVATLTGSLLRFPYTLATSRFGGRNWTVFSAVVLTVPVTATIVLLANPGQPLWVYLLCAALAGFGGGNFASSMTNINAFYPQRLKGWALGLNAGGGNLGVPAVQLVGLLVIAWTGVGEPYWVCAVYLVLLAVAGLGAALFMDNLEGPGVDLSAMRSAITDRDTWLISLLYIGTFGSFIGFSFAFSQVLALNFLDRGDTAAQASLHAAQIAFIGPLLGSVARVYGGRLADRIGGSRVTLGVFAGMVGAAAVLLVGSSLEVQVVGFVALFVLSGMGNGSVYKIIPSVFDAKSRALPLDEDGRAAYSRAMSGAVIGIAGAVGGLGGVGINMVLRQSYLSSGSATVAVVVFAAFYLVAAAVTWRAYVGVPRAAADAPGAPQSAKLSS